MDSSDEHAVGLLELVPSSTLLPPFSPNQQLSEEELQANKSKVTLVNHKLIELAVSRCTKQLYVGFSGEQSPERESRELVSVVYNTLWDYCLASNKIGLNCTVLTGTNGTTSVVSLFSPVTFLSS